MVALRGELEEDIRYWCVNALQTFSCTTDDPCLHPSVTGTRSGYSCQVHRLARTILTRLGDSPFTPVPSSGKEVR